MGIIRGDNVLIQPRDEEPRLYQYQLGAEPKAMLQPAVPKPKRLQEELEAYVQAATQALLDDKAGVEVSKNRSATEATVP